LFYIITVVVAHFAYREYKGIAEDQAKGSVDLVDGNYLHYGVIAKREDDRIEYEEEYERRKKERDERLKKEEDDREALLNNNNDREDV